MLVHSIRCLAISLVVQVFTSGLALGVEHAEVKIEGRWSVVGVISGEPNTSGKATGIAVLRSNLTKKTYTLAVGDSIPNEFGFVLKSVQAHSVQIASAGSQAVTLNFADTIQDAAADTTATSDMPSRASRFLGSYYRGFNRSQQGQSRGLIEDEEDDDGDVNYLQAPRTFGAPRLSNAHDEANTAPEAYRPRTYKMDEDGEGFSVNFDDEFGP